MTATHLPAFDYWIEAARWELNQLQKYTTSSVRRICLDGALANMTRALTAANKAGCPARKALCMRVLNWIRADLRRAS